MSQEQLVEQAISVIEIVRRINEVLKDSEIAELCRRLDSYATALDAVVNKKYHWFDVQFVLVSTAHAGTDFTVRLYVKGEYIYSISVERNTTIEQMFEKVFSSQELKTELTNRIYDILSEIASEIASKANIVQRVKELEERLREEDP